MSIQGWFPLGLTGLISLLSKGLSRVFSSTTVQKHQFFGAQPSLQSNSHTHTWLLENPQLWLYGPLSAKRSLCFFNGPTLTPKEGEKVEAVTDFIFLVSKITADSDCSHETKRPLLLGKKVMTNLDSRLKSRDITLPTKFCLVKVMVFTVVIYERES